MIMRMKRKITSEMMTTYLPSTLLLMITFATTFFKPYFFEAALTVNLTTMLVMTIIFISKMEGLPSTAYMEMIDIWLILCQLVPFVEVVLFTAKEYLRQDDDEGEVLQGRGPGLKHLYTFVGLSRASLVLKFIGKFKTEKIQTKKNRTIIHRFLHIGLTRNVSPENMVPLTVAMAITTYFGLATFYYLQ